MTGDQLDDDRKTLQPRLLSGVSLFSGAGIGDVGFRAAGVSFIAMCEKEPDRAALAKLNFPEATVYAQDINDVTEVLCKEVSARLRDEREELFLLTCTAPCQGMSKNGQGTLLRNIRNGSRPQLDPRNRLILPALDIVKKLRPRWLILENVFEMRHTAIEDEKGAVRLILDIIFDSLAPDYVGQAYDVEFADFGIPQRRQRLITVLTRDATAIRRFRSGVAFIPTATHAKYPTLLQSPWVTVSEALKGYRTLDAVDEASAADKTLPFHRVPVLDPKKYEWIRHTPPGKSAFDNQCINPDCQFLGNKTHGASHDKDGINRAHRKTPLYCEKCGKLLPRPYTAEQDTLRLMSGYTSAYKRMDPNLPAPALTRNLSYPCSDQKIHPFQNRVLSLAEAMTLQTIDRYDYRWGPIAAGKAKRRNSAAFAPDSLIRLVIGESVPPQFLEMLMEHLKIVAGDLPLPESVSNARRRVQPTLW